MSKPTKKKVYGLLAEYDTAAAVFHACEQVRDAGYSAWDSHTPFAVHNLDNQRGGAALRIPKCQNAQAYDFGFRDVDSDALNEWLATDSGSELVFTAPANNPQRWNTLFNFWFDSDAAPVAGDVTIDQALIGPGAHWTCE